jgi:tetratricopeptide (TPR) repeat protein
MLPVTKPASFLLLAIAVVSLGACSLFQPQPTVPPKPAYTPPTYDLVASIRAAGAREKSVIDVNPLRDAGVATLQDAAKSDEQAGRYADAAGKLDQALKLSPNSPDLLQDRAEIAVRMKDYPLAEKLAHQSWSLGPKLGPLCARNWQTVVEMRLQQNDQAGAETARKWVQQCHKPGQPRF